MYAANRYNIDTKKRDKIMNDFTVQDLEQMISDISTEFYAEFYSDQNPDGDQEFITIHRQFAETYVVFTVNRLIQRFNELMAPNASE
jgi:hypothetical protein